MAIETKRHIKLVDLPFLVLDRPGSEIQGDLWIYLFFDYT